jgi:hypothetical protein
MVSQNEALTKDQANHERYFHHPHLRGTKVRDQPLNVFSNEDAAAIYII